MEARFRPIVDTSKLMNYRHGGQWQLRSNDEGTVLVHWKPRTAEGRESTKRYLRIECNPAKLHRGCIQTIYRRLEPWLGEAMTFENFVQEVRFTRFDLTFDIKAPIEEMIFFHLLRKTNSYTYTYPASKFTPHGTIRQHTIGAPNSDRQATLYDKNEESGKAATCGVYSGYCTTLEGRQIPVLRRIVPRTRFELTLKKVNSLNELLSLKNPFENYNFKQFIMLRHSLPKHKFLFFLDSCRVRGAQAALSLIDDQRERTRYANAIKEVPNPSWWDPNVIRNELPRALHRILAFEDA